METSFPVKKRVGNLWGGRGERLRDGEVWGRTGRYGEGRGGMGYPPQFARNDGVLAVNSKAEKFERVRLAHCPPRVKENLTEFLEKFP